MNILWLGFTRIGLIDTYKNGSIESIQFTRFINKNAVIYLNSFIRLNGWQRKNEQNHSTFLALNSNDVYSLMTCECLSSIFIISSESNIKNILGIAGFAHSQHIYLINDKYDL